MDGNFVRERITSLRMMKGVSEYAMSLDLGKSRGYINNISSGKSLPSLSELFNICDYLEISVRDFFNSADKTPEKTARILDMYPKMNEEDKDVVLHTTERLYSYYSKVPSKR